MISSQEKQIVLKEYIQALINSSGPEANMIYISSIPPLSQPHPKGTSNPRDQGLFRPNSSLPFGLPSFGLTA
jgi:hypothetical protein